MDRKEDIQIVKTADGSHSIYVKSLDEHYHSGHGALQESLHVYLRSGFDFFMENQDHSGKLKIFEVGFGTGLNALLTLMRSRNEGVKVIYDSIELYPLPEEVFPALNYPELTGISEKDYQMICQAPWNEASTISDHFVLKKIHGDFFHTNLNPEYYNLIYFDAFGYRAQSEFWTEEVFLRLYNAMSAGAILVTYASKGLARRAMEKVGFKVDRIPGAPGKREMIRAFKTN